MPVPNNQRKYSIQGCRAETLMGIWLVAESYIESMFGAALAVFADGARMEQVRQRSMEMEDAAPAKAYQVDGNGIAHMSISGPMTKFKTSFSSMLGGTSTVELRDALRDVRQLGGVQGIMLHFDSSGGTAEGTPELADAIRKTAKMMPVFGHAEDKCCSAALFAASGLTRFTNGVMAAVGSVGTLLRLMDVSKAVEKSDAKPIYFASGKFKTLGAPGTEINQEAKDELMRFVNQNNEVFWDYVQTGRPGTKAHKEEILTARLFIGKDAQRVGLSDATCTSDEAYQSLLKYISQGSGVGGPSSGKDSIAAQHAGPTPARSKTMLNSQQLSQARALPGGSQIAEDNADVTLLSIANATRQELATAQTELTTKQAEITRLTGLVPKEPDKGLLRSYGILCHKQIDQLSKEGKITPAQATPMKDFFMSGDPAKPETLKFNVPMLTPAQDGKCGYEPLLAVYDLNKPNGIVKEVTGAQPAQRTEPGASDQKDDITGVTLERQNELRVKIGLAPLVPAKA